MPGIMEHVERTGIHSGDSIAVYPAKDIDDELRIDTIEYIRAVRVVCLDERWFDSMAIDCMETACPTESTFSNHDAVFTNVCCFQAGTIHKGIVVDGNDRHQINLSQASTFTESTHTQRL